MLDFKRRRFLQDIIMICVRWYIAYPLSYRNVEEMMAERGINLDHSTLNRWVIHYAAKISEEVKRRRRAIGKSWRLDETYVKVQGQWKYLLLIPRRIHPPLSHKHSPTLRPRDN